MSANNVRDVIRVLLDQGIVGRVQTKGKWYVKYALTAEGKNIRILLIRASQREHEIKNLRIEIY